MTEGDRCLMCGVTDELTVEHIVPQTLWKRFGIDPDREDLARYRTTLCETHNRATSVLHERSAMLDFICDGEPLCARTLGHLGDWAVWVTLLLGLARGSGVLDAEATRALLRRRFDDNTGGTPRGFRVYVARVGEYVEASTPAATRYALALTDDDRVSLSPAGEPMGYSVRSGPMHAAEAIGLGKVALLVVGRTHSSGPNHTERLDDAATGVGMARIHPPPVKVPALEPRRVCMSDISKRFTVMPFGTDVSLMPANIRLLAQTWSS